MYNKNTKKNIKNRMNKTKKRRYYLSNNIVIPNFRILTTNSYLYASKRFSGEQILEFTKKNEEESNKKCNTENLSWFGGLREAEIYKTKDTKIYRWKIKSPTKLILTDSNEKFYKKLFENTKHKLTTTINLTEKEVNQAINLIKQQLKSINYSYLEMKLKDRAWYEFAFAYGFINVNEQYEFMKLIKFLIENKFFDILKRDGTSILNKINTKLIYYNVNQINNEAKKKKHNRLSLYAFDKSALMNLCNILPSKYDFAGVYQPERKSFWFPDLKIYKMSIKEIVLFNPHKNLIFDKLIEY